jgi:S-DNA-T family DNA segregation ATPase FtsK/SpoIIIE
VNILREFWYFLTDQDEPLEIKEVVNALWAKEKRPQMGKPKKTALGWEFNFTLPAGISFRDFANKAEYFRDALGNVNVEVVRAGKQAKLKVITSLLKQKYPYDWSVKREGILPVQFGYSTDGLKILDLAKHEHILIGGETGSGKTTLLNSIICSLLTLPEPPIIVLIDLKVSGDYSYLEDKLTLITDRGEAYSALGRLMAEVIIRQRKLKATKCPDNIKYNERNSDKMPYIILIIDELAQLKDPDAQEVLEDLLSLSRASGVRIIGATQRPSAKIFRLKSFGDAKANFTIRVCYRTMSGIDSKIILDATNGADLPKIPGRGILRIGCDLFEIQTPYLDPEVAERELSSVGSAKG